jgi:hypothetical protein
MLKFDPTQRLGAGSTKDDLDMASLKAHRFFTEIDFVNLQYEESPLIAVYNEIENKDNQHEYDDLVDDLFVSDEYQSDALDFTSKMTSVVFNRDTPLNTVREEENEGCSLESNSMLRLSEFGAKSKSKLANDPQPIEEEKIVPARHLSNVTDDEPVMKSTISHESEEEETDRKHKSTSKIPMLELNEDSVAKTKLVVIEGGIKKRSTLFIYRKRHLELSIQNGRPRLVYYYASKKKFRNEIMLTQTTKAILK